MEPQLAPYTRASTQQNKKKLGRAKSSTPRQSNFDCPNAQRELGTQELCHRSLQSTTSAMSQSSAIWSIIENTRLSLQYFRTCRSIALIPRLVHQTKADAAVDETNSDGSERNSEENGDDHVRSRLSEKNSSLPYVFFFLRFFVAQRRSQRRNHLSSCRLVTATQCYHSQIGR